MSIHKYATFKKREHRVHRVSSRAACATSPYVQKPEMKRHKSVDSVDATWDTSKRSKCARSVQNQFAWRILRIIINLP